MAPSTSVTSLGTKTTSSASVNKDNGNEDDDTNSLSIGFLGCGTIASAIAKGLATASQKHSTTTTTSSIKIKHISVTRRSQSKSAALLERFPSLISIHDDPQEVVDASDVLFVCVLPTQTQSVLQSLKLKHNQQLVSLVSTATLDELCQYTTLPPTNVFQMICLPAVARNNGVCLLLTPHQNNPPIVYELCQWLGGCVEAKTKDEMASLMTVSGMMGSFYGVLRRNHRFLTEKGIKEKDAAFLVGRMYDNMIQDVAEGINTTSNDDDASKSSENDTPTNTIFDHLIAEQTPGGLNEQGLANLESLGVMESYDQVMAAMLSRIRGETDGSLLPPSTTTKATK
eukprot:CAMPEP_0195522094 /NCGR_PEP_ID=MMETSP0794_2-20130614/20030_1 /TAXON_ID=515487 /ORGANISM="Stephanopyxis turris, Strain CCMP 815" /LENGTH=340 /DNA_ID=CAMNT_0040651781 /DNA_START=63 /DNA_END=1085 /DNA_ORIENTATION=-